MLPRRGLLRSAIFASSFFKLPTYAAVRHFAGPLTLGRYRDTEPKTRMYFWCAGCFCIAL